ncbi:MAG: cohesin domain-containing protein, partial [Terriglobia bacterium]
LRFDPAQTRVGVNQEAVVNLVVENIQDLFAVPFALSFDPQVVELVRVHHGSFMGGEFPAALVYRAEAETGTAIISVSRPPGATGVSGQGVLVTLVFRGVRPGQSVLKVDRIAARASDRQSLEVETQAGLIIVERTASRSQAIPEQ